MTQSIYSIEPYARLKEVVSNYCRDRGFVVGEDPEDKLDEYTLLQRWKDGEAQGDGYCYAIIYATRGHYSYLGSGTLVRVDNIRSTLSSRRPPEAVRHLFSATPNAITFESHRYWDDAAKWLARNVSTLVSGSRNQRVLVTLDDRILSIKSNPTLSLEERFVELNAAMTQSVPEALDFGTLSGALARSLTEATWTELTEAAKACLQSGIVAYDRFDGISTVELETSPAVIALSKALEETVTQRVLLPFRSFVQGGNPIADGGSGELNRLRQYARSTQARPLELGTVAAQLAHMDTLDTSHLPPTAGVYFAFLSTLNDPAFVRHELPSALQEIARRFRNPAAHPELLDFARLHEFTRVLIGDSGAEGLLARVVRST